jgi:hypothetical protein
VAAKGKIVNTTPRNFLRDRVLRYIKVVRSGGPTRDPGSFHAPRRQPKPLFAASGPGSINADAEMHALISAGKREEAAAYFETHKARTYKSGAWERSKLNLWYAHYKAGTGAAL